MEQEMSGIFNRALYSYDKQYAIELYNKEIENNPSNFAAWNNRGVSKIEVAVENSDYNLAVDGKNDILKAIAIQNDYPIAVNNIKWADKAIQSIQHQ